MRRSSERLTATLLGLGAAVAVGPARAEPPVTVTLEEAIARALEASPELERLRAEAEGAEARTREAELGRLPRVSYTQVLGLVNRARGDAVFSPDEETDFLNGLGPFTRIDLEIVQPLYTFGLLEAGIEAAGKGHEAARASVARHAQQVTFAVKDLYQTILFNRSLAEAFEELVGAFERAVAGGEARLADGRATQADVLKARYGLSGVRAGLNRVRAGEATALSALRRAMGLPVEVVVDLADARLAPARVTPPPLAEARRLALARRADLDELRAGLAAIEARAALARAEMLPTLFAAGILQYAVAPNRSDAKNPFVFDQFNYIRPGVALGLRWTFGFDGIGRLDALGAEQRALAARLGEAVSGIELEVERAHRDLHTAEANVAATGEGRRATRALMLLHVSSFELGLGGAEPLFEALGLHARATTDHLQAVREQVVAVARLEQAMGGGAALDRAKD